MRGLSALILIATLPLAAGFAFSVNAQGLTYDAPDAAVPMGVSSTAAPTNMTREAALEQQVRELTNQLEQRDFQIRQLQQNFDKFSADTAARLQALEGKLSGTITGTEAPANAAYTPPENPPAPTPVQNAAIPSSAGAQEQSGAVSGELVDPNGAFRPASTPQLGQITESGDKPSDIITSGKPQTQNAAKAYDDAYADLQSGNNAAAQSAFLSFLTTYPTHPLAANAQYWLGESYFAQGQYGPAAKTFAKAFQEHPQGQKAPDALLKLALTLEKMNKKNDACLTLGELPKRFASGPASILQRGAEEAARMGCKS